MHIHNKRQSFFGSKIVFLFLVGSLIYFLVSITNNFLMLRSYRADMKKQRADIDLLLEDNVQLKELLTFVTSEEAVTEYARTQLGLQQPGEHAFIISKEHQANDEAGSSEYYKKENNPKKWLTYFLAPK